MSQVGLVVCRCGNNISDAIDFDAVMDWARNYPSIQFVVAHDLLCSGQGKRDFVTLLQDKKPSAVIVAACSPRMHDVTFRTLAVEAGLNIAQTHMANIRELAAWVTPDRAEATQKSIALIRAAVERCLRHENLEPRSMECISDLVVIGGGIAGMEAALLAAQAGRKVTLIEKNIALGGRAIHSEELAPTMECTPCLLSPRLFKIKDDPNIRVIAQGEVQDILGFLGNFTVKVLKKARYVNEKCIGCEACFEACPVNVDHEFHLGLGQRKAIYTLFPGAVPAMAAIDKNHCRHFIDGSCQACKEACPFDAIEFDQTDEEVSVPAGAIILATGFEPLNPSKLRTLGYGSLPNVYTLPEFERLASSNGPRGGKILLKDGSPPDSVAILQVSDPTASPASASLLYPGLVSLWAAKVGFFIRKQIPNVQVTHVVQQLVFEGPEAQAFHQKELAAGTRFLPLTNPATLKVTAKGKYILITAQGLPALKVSMVVIATDMVPTSSHPELARLAHLELNPAGFFQVDHRYLRSTATTLEGIYTAGGCSAPCNVPTAVIQAQAAAGEAISQLVPGRKIELEYMTAAIDPDRCGGCKLCIAVCPYHAIQFDPGACISQVNEALCHGCGTCAAGCPTGAAQAKQFTHEQLSAELEGILHE